MNIYKDRIKNAAHLPALPNAGQLAAALAPHYWALASIGAERARARPLYSITADQAHASAAFLQARAQVLCAPCCSSFQNGDEDTN